MSKSFCCDGFFSVSSFILALPHSTCAVFFLAFVYGLYLSWAMYFLSWASGHSNSTTYCLNDNRKETHKNPYTCQCVPKQAIFSSKGMSMSELAWVLLILFGVRRKELMAIGKFASSFLLVAQIFLFLWVVFGISSSVRSAFFQHLSLFSFV